MALLDTVLCPIDFSDATRGSIRYAAAIADHFHSRLVALAVEDPLLTEAMDLATGVVWTPEDTRRELRTFVEAALDGCALQPAALEYAVAVGKPAREILRAAADHAAGLIVMSTHGLTGMRKLFFGSTTERVLRETTVPVLTTPATEAGPKSVADISGLIRRILVPVDGSPASLTQVQIARSISEILHAPMVLTHVVEPVQSPLAARLHLRNIELERRARAEDALADLLATVPRDLKAEALVAYGDPAEEVVKVARDRQAQLLVIGLHSTPLMGPRMGSVTYRVLCLTPALVLALPPAPFAAAGSLTTTSPG